MDVLFVFQHSKADDLEIRYALRGIARHLPWIRKVWIFGDRPAFISDDLSRIEHVPHARLAKLDGSPVPIRNFFKMLFFSSLIGDLSPDYLWFCDDFIMIADCTPDEMCRVRCLDDLANAKSRGTGLWKGSLWRTYDLLKRLGYSGYNFETHVATYFHKDWVFDAYCDFRDFISNDRWHGMLGPTAILNHAYKHRGFPLVKLHDEGWHVGWHGRPPALDEIVEKTRGKRFLNFDDDAFGDDMRRFLAGRFPHPCCYEQSGSSAECIAVPEAPRKQSLVHFPVVVKESDRGTFVASCPLSSEAATAESAVEGLAEQLRRVQFPMAH